MRLIDDDSVIETLKETGIIQDNDLGHLVVDEINRIPTTYDIDKVVEELEKIQDKAVSVKNEDISIYATGIIGKAIEIVKRGGVCGRCTEVGGCPVREDCPNEPNVCE